jgi:hypothetical protein
MHERIASRPRRHEKSAYDIVQKVSNRRVTGHGRSEKAAMGMSLESRRPSHPSVVVRLGRTEDSDLQFLDSWDWVANLPFDS